MKKYFPLIVFFILCSCSAPDKALMLDKEILFSTQNSLIYKFNLSDGESIKVFDAYEKSIEILQIDKINKNEIILEEFFDNGKSIIKKFNLDTKKEESIIEGRSPTIISDKGDFLFFKRNDQNKWWLMKTNIHEPDKQTPIIWVKDLTKFFSPKIIETRTNHYVFSGLGNQLWSVDFDTNKVAREGIDKCYPLLFRKNPNELLCQEDGSGKKFFVNLETKKTRYLPELDQYYGFIHLPDSDQVIVSKANLENSINFESYVYTFDKRSLIKISNKSFDAGIALN